MASPAPKLAVKTLKAPSAALTKALIFNSRTHMHFFVEITDTFQGEANYSHVSRHKVKATTPRGAMRRIGKASGLSWHLTENCQDHDRYDSKSGATCAFVMPWEEEHLDYLQLDLTTLS